MPIRNVSWIAVAGAPLEELSLTFSYISVSTLVRCPATWTTECVQLWALVEGQTDVCQRFSAFGWCPNGSECLFPTTLTLIILQDEKDLGNKRTKRKRRKEKKER
ncbi:hypothetical protein KUCAC02_019212 [Chaenocephalus aceratus]|uniref:Uncharacterized protein n=1 Tax=Chaenocephalus aceratus TaxID=36190 RepID=A0ACB9WCE5_CHAAC|nr:hypothetical protein KUCAC02_019212 [Chaenocephalus aceratus]